MKRKKWLVKLVCVGMVMLFTGCGASDIDAEPSVNGAEVVQETVEEVENILVEATEETEDVEQSEEELAVENVQNELIEETASEEPKVEMVDFETWAKQEGNEEVCLVVWNEELGIQEIIPTRQEVDEVYEIQEGDKFAISYNKSIRAVRVNKEDITPPLVDYREVSLRKGEVNQIVIIFENQQGENETINYVLK